MLYGIRSLLDSRLSVCSNQKAQAQKPSDIVLRGLFYSQFMTFNLSIQLKLFAFLSLFFLWPSIALAGKVAHILIITNSNDSSFQDAIQGFKERLSTQEGINFSELTLVQAKSSNAIKQIRPQLIYALGSETPQWASLETSDIPIVTTMVLKDDVFRKSANITGISLDYSLKTQFQWLKKFFPQKQEVAVLYNPQINNSIIESAKNISQQEGFHLVAIPVESPKQLPFALEQLANKIEILFAIPDETVMSANTAKEVLLASFSNKVPMIGLSDNWVRSGAFYALSWDFRDLGRQCAELAQKLLAGASVSSVPPERPRKITYTINAKIAEHMNLNIPEDLRKNAKMVFN